MPVLIPIISSDVQNTKVWQGFKTDICYCLMLTSHLWVPWKNSLTLKDDSSGKAQRKERFIFDSLLQFLTNLHLIFS